MRTTWRLPVSALRMGVSEIANGSKTVVILLGSDANLNPPFLCAHPNAFQDPTRGALKRCCGSSMAGAAEPFP